MSVSSTSLLRALGSVVRPPGVERAPSDGIASLSFDELLKRAAAGQVRSDAPITLAPDCGVQLSDEQLAKVALAADQAEAQGVSRALVCIDGMMLKLDVGVRTITGKIDPSTSGLYTGIDGVVTFSPDDSAAQPNVGLQALAGAQHLRLTR